MAGYIGKSKVVTQVNGYTQSEADSNFVDTSGDTMTGELIIGNDADTVLTLDRDTTDGPIIDLQKDGTSGGLIGVNGGRAFFARTSGGGVKLASSYGLEPCNGIGNDWDGVQSLGSSVNRFSNLHLKNNIYAKAMALKDTGSSHYNGIRCIDNNKIGFNTKGLERMRIDNSGNVLVGKTAYTSVSTNGVTLASDGAAYASTSSQATLSLNRNTTDGSILDFYKDGTTVGSIGTGLSSLSVGTGNTQLMFWNAQNGIFPSNGSTVTDNSIDFGNPNYRFKDLYLSGGVYLGGTGAANKLDDYEEGTWTPSIEGSTTSGSYSTVTAVGRYFKIGKQVTLLGYVNASGGTGTGSVRLRGLPFNVTGSMASYPFQCNGGASIPSGYNVAWLWNSGTTEFIARTFNGSSYNNLPYPAAPAYWRFSIVYETT